MVLLKNSIILVGSELNRRVSERVSEGGFKSKDLDSG